MRPWPAATATKTRLVIAPQWVGDAVMAAPMMASLARSGPLDVVCLPHLADLFQAMPFLRRVLPMAFERGRLQWFERRRQAHGLIDAHYQQAIVCPNSWKAALLPWFANIPQRTGLVGEWRYGLLNDIRHPNSSSDPQSTSQPALYAVLADDALAVDAHRLSQTPLLLAKQAEQQPTRPQLALCPGAEFGPAKQWPASHYAELARQWLTAGGQVVVLGGPKDQGIGDAIRWAIQAGHQDHQALVGYRMLAGQTSLAQAMTELASSALVVSNDSGLMHVAAALGRPCLGLYGSTSEVRTPAFGLNWQPLSRSMPCRPCYDRQCRLGTTACLQELEPTRVVEAAQAKGWWPDQLDLRHAN
ncbi:MAG: Lipopolysaccharide heptosyltransferase [Pseudomonadota bacterium]